MSKLLRTAACSAVCAGMLAVAAQAQTGPLTSTQVQFAGRVVDNVQPDALRLPATTMAKQLLNGPLPFYPATTLERWGALVQVLVLIDPKGVVTTVLATDGPADLAAAASSAALQWTFRPNAKSVVTTLPLLFLPAPVAGQPGRIVYMPTMVHLSAGVLAAHNTHKVIPSGARGTIVFHVVIDPHGAVAAASMVSGSPQFRDAWEQALADWRYQPYILNGEPVWVESTVTVSF